MHRCGTYEENPDFVGYTHPLYGLTGAQVLGLGKDQGAPVLTDYLGFQICSPRCPLDGIWCVRELLCCGGGKDGQIVPSPRPHICWLQMGWASLWASEWSLPWAAGPFRVSCGRWAMTHHTPQAPWP